MVLVNVDDRVFRETTANDRKETGREDFAVVPDEHNPATVRDSERRSRTMRTSDFRGGGFRFLVDRRVLRIHLHRRGEARVREVRAVFRRRERVASLLQDVTAVVRRFGRLDRERFRKGMTVKFRENFPIFRRGNADLLDAAPDRNEEKDRPHHHAGFFEQVGDFVDQMRVAASDRRVHLDGKLEVASVTHHIEGFSETAFETAEGVVNFRRRAVEADSDRGDARFFRFLERVERRERRRARGQRRADSEVGRAAD